jgi:hypothetical protein
VNKGFAGNDTPYLVAALVEPSLNLLITFIKYRQHFDVNPNLKNVMDGLGHISDDDMHLICVSINREIKSVAN